MEERAVVYIRGTRRNIRGTGRKRNVWYRVCFDGKEEGGGKIEPIAGGTTYGGDSHPKHYNKTLTVGGAEGSWTVVKGDHCDNIYWAAGSSYNLIYKRWILKQEAKFSNFGSWLYESKSRILPRGLPFIAAVGRKLYLIAGTEDDNPRFNIDWTNGCGEVYDLDTRTFRSINFNIVPQQLSYYDTRHAALVVKHGATDEPTGIVFYSFTNGSMLYLDLANPQSSHTSDGHCSFASLWNRTALPPGLEDSNINMLHHVTTTIRAVFKDDTLYWFGYDMCLYGYDVSRRIWLRSPSLAPKLGSLTTCFDACHISPHNPSMASSQHPNHPLLVGLPNGKFVVICSELPGELTMASLVVVKDEGSLNVLVEYSQSYSLDDASFVPSDGMAVLKTSDFTMRRPAKTRMEF